MASIYAASEARRPSRSPEVSLTLDTVNDQALDPYNHQGKFGEGFVCALAHAAALKISRGDIDYDGVDYEFTLIGRARGHRYPKIEAQVKSWSTPKSADELHWNYDRLTQRQFNRLAGADFHVPRFLFVVIVPTDARDYTFASHDALRLSHAAYWVSLERHTRISEDSPDKYVKVAIPKTQLLDVETLVSLFDPKPGVL